MLGTICAVIGIEGAYNVNRLQRYNKYPNLARVFVYKFAYM